MKPQATDRQARSRSSLFAYLLGLLVLFLVGVTGGLWVSIRYFDTPVAEISSPETRAPGRITGGVAIPTWIDHPFRRRENSYLSDFSYRAAMSDLNRIFFGEAMASVPSGNTVLGEEYEGRRIRGLLNADDERLYQERFQAESRAALDRVGRIQGNRAEATAIGIGERENLSVLRAPGTALYLAATAFSGRPLRTRVGSGTVIRSQTVSKDDYRFQIDQDVTEFGLGFGTAYDSIDHRRSLSIRQNLSQEWAIGVDRAISGGEVPIENTIRIQFVAPF